MRKRDIQIGKRYQCSSGGQLVTCRVISKGWLWVNERHEAQWDYGDPAYPVYSHKFYWQIIEEF